MVISPIDFIGSCRVAQWVRRWTLPCEVPGSNPLAAAVVSLGKALLSSLPSSSVLLPFPLDKEDDLKEDKLAMENKTAETAKRMARKKLAANQKNEEMIREGLEGFKFKDQGIKAIANTYKHLAKAFMELAVAKPTSL